MSLENAIKLPFTNVNKLVTGCIIAIVSFLLGAYLMPGGIAIFSIVPIIYFFVSGFQLSATEKAFKGKFELPEWKNNFGNFWMTGLKMFIIIAIYMLPANIVLWISGVNKIMSTVDPAELKVALMAAPGIIGYLVIGGILTILALYILPAAQLAFAKTGSLKDGFNFGNAFRKAFSGKYFISIVLLGLYSLVVTIILSMIPYVGYPISQFIVGVTWFSGLAEVYAKIK